MGKALDLTRMRRNLLTMRPNERPGNSQCIYIRPDLTKAQIEIDKKLKAEWAIMGKDNFMIKKGRIVPRPTMETQTVKLIKNLRVRS